MLLQFLTENVRLIFKRDSYVKKIAILSVAMIMLTACAVGPDYKRPCVPTPAKFTEADKNWKTATPHDQQDRGAWWEIFHDPKLNALENQVNISNQTIATALAQYQQARALVAESRAAFFPLITANADITRQRQGSGSASFVSTSTTGALSTGSATTGGGGGSTNPVTTTHTLGLDASWEPDLWGTIRRTVEASEAGAASSSALLANTRLSTQASLAQFYYQLRALDKDQQILDRTVADYQHALTLTQNRYKVGVAAQTDVIQARTQLESAKALAINNGINRAQLEHAIAVLIGKPPEEFNIPPSPLNSLPPAIPLSVPSALLERRPDIASAERLMAQANAQIGVAIAAYFPTLTLTASANETHPDFSHWFSVPDLSWAIGPQLAQTIFDGGLRKATVAAARYNYNATAATYKQTVLAAFQDVEDNLVSLRTLHKEYLVQARAAADARLSLQLITNQYKAGTTAYSDVITAQTTAYNAEKTAADVIGLEMTSAVGLIKALGGDWNVCDLNKPCCVKTASKHLG
jgi:NodT family efflux transporter outer membrane factor (OMF) lipoprotein